MNNLIGSIPEFVVNVDDWKTYEENLNKFFEVNNISESDRKTSILINLVGSEINEILKNLCQPDDSASKTFEELCRLLRGKLCPQIGNYRDKANFYDAKQEKRETVTAWFERIKTLSVVCKFNNNSETILLDKFITGLRSSVIFDRLCEETQVLNLVQALEIAVNKESAIMEGVEPGSSSSDSQTGKWKSRRHCARNDQYGHGHRGHHGRHGHHDHHSQHGDSSQHGSPRRHGHRGSPGHHDHHGSPGHREHHGSPGHHGHGGHHGHHGHDGHHGHHEHHKKMEHHSPHHYGHGNEKHHHGHHANKTRHGSHSPNCGHDRHGRHANKPIEILSGSESDKGIISCNKKCNCENLKNIHVAHEIVAV